MSRLCGLGLKAFVGLGLIALPVVSAAQAYDDVPDGALSEPAPVISGPVYGYAAARPGARVYGYGPVHRMDVEPMVRRDRRPLGTYAPSESDNLSPPRAFFRGIERESGGN